MARADLFITSKVWNGGMDDDAVRRAVQDSLDRIGLDLLDLMLVHWPFPAQDRDVAAWKTLIAGRDDGQVTSIGVCNHHVEHLDRIIGETAEVPVLNQIEINPMLRQHDMRRVNDTRNIVTQSRSPPGKGRSFGAAPIKAVADRTGKAPAHVVLRWHRQTDGAVIARPT